jgi:hypothetical protein
MGAGAAQQPKGLPPSTPGVFVLRKTSLLVLVGVCLAGSLHAQTFQCSNSNEDMLNYFLMGYPDRIDNFMASSNANPIYSSVTPELGSGYAQQGSFVWTKSPQGYPWDVKTFDKNYIYDRSTELVWTDPTSFKRFNKDLPLSRRCISPNSGAAIKIRKDRTAYTFYSDCTAYQTADLSYVTTQISKPIMVDTGGNLSQVKTRTLTYTYSCNSSYSNCLYKEVYSLGYNVGLYDWKYYVSQNKQWQLVQESIINNFSLGQSVPMFTCPNTYQ